MKYKPLGKSGELISALGQGTMGLGGYFSRDTANDSQVVKLLQKGIDLGMSLIDTAEVYGNGHSEELVGEAVKGRRDRVFIASKFSPEHSRYEDVISAVENSLQRLQTDRLDLLQTHWRNYQVPLEETARAMTQLVLSGKVRYLGVSNFTVRETKELQHHLDGQEIVSLQQEYNTLEHSIETTILPFCQAEQKTLIAYTPLLHRPFEPGEPAADVMAQITRKYSLSTAQVILNWLASKEQVVAIPKSGSPAHLAENASALDVEITHQDLEELSRIFVGQVEQIPTGIIKVADDLHRNVYRTREEAVENRFHNNPSPVEMSREILKGELLKPIKVKRDPEREGHYLLVEGRVKYWGWVIAYGEEQPIPALVL